MKRDAQKLAGFLRGARARISPASVGLPVGRRRVAGLRSDEVAELIGVSGAWYARCESGAAQLSIAALERLAAVLRLSRDERATLISLARPDVVALSPSAAGDALCGAGAIANAFRRFARVAAQASGVEELAAGAAIALRGAFGSASLGYFIANDSAAQTQRYLGIAGPSRCDPLLGYEQPSSATDHLRAALVSGEFFEEADVAVSPSRDFRRLNDALGTRSYHAIAIPSDAGDWRYALGCALTEARPATELERSIVATIGSIAELCARTVS
jgi:transcriptional regulator with XRE-family HTH domain